MAHVNHGLLVRPWRSWAFLGDLERSRAFLGFK
jgi:hypothetical protein